MPRQHLTSQAPAGVPFSQLQALAGLHERIRRGTATSSGLHVTPADLQQPGAERISDTLLSPTADCALVVWQQAEVLVNREDLTTSGLCIIGWDATGAGWTCPRPGRDAVELCLVGTSLCGGLSVAFCALATGGDGHVACVYTVHKFQWLPEVPLEGCGISDADEVVKSSGAASPVLAAFKGWWIGEDGLVVFDLQQQAAWTFPNGYLWQFVWLPGTHDVLLLQNHGLARLTVLPAPSVPDVPWVALPVLEASDTTWRMQVTPQGKAVWVSQALRRGPGAWRARLSAYLISDMAILGSWLLRMPAEAFPNLQVSCQALAVSFTASALCVSASYR